MNLDGRFAVDSIENLRILLVFFYYDFELYFSWRFQNSFVFTLEDSSKFF